MNYYNEIKNKIIDEEVYSKIKDYSKERHKVITYYEIGKLLSEAEGKYGDNIIEKYSKKLVIEVGKKYNKRTLYRMKQFYNVFSNERVSTMWTQLNWSVIRELLSIENIDKINYYIFKSYNENISVRRLQGIIKSQEYERLDEVTKNKLVSNDNLEIKDLIPNPILIQSKDNKEILSEKVLHHLILEDISGFMKELGSGYSFIDSEYKIKIGSSYNYIDLLLYNIEFNCYVVIELKVTELKKEHIGQVQIYMNYIDNNLKKITQDKTIGIIIVKKDNKFIMEYCSDERILSRTYQLL